jgi:predicted nucleotidyltransferase
MSDVNKWLTQNTIFKGVLGSRAYGIHNADSDYDYRAVAIAPKQYYLGLDNFEQQETKNPDSTVFDIQKFTKLALECNPNIIEYLFLHPENILINTPYWDILVENRDIFLSKRAKHRYLGYAYSQLKRVQSHKQWLLNPVDHKPTREEYGLPATESLNRELIGQIELVTKDCLKENLDVILNSSADELTITGLRNYLEFDVRGALDEAFADFVYPTIFNLLINKIDVMSTLAIDNFSEEIVAVYTKEKSYSSAMSRWKQYQNWVDTRNPARAELEAKFGYDTKHIGHVFRLLKQGQEILLDKTLTVKLKPEDKEEILAIKAGKFTYDEIIDLASMRMAFFEELYERSTLPHSPDFNKANTLLVKTIEKFYEDKNETNC